MMPGMAPNPVPVIVTEVLIAAEEGLMLVMFDGRTVKLVPELATPPTVTTTLPVLVVGTTAVMLVGLQLVGDTTIPLKASVLRPCNAPKFVPVILTEVPTWAEEGFMLVIDGVGTTVKAAPLLATAPTVTTTLPVVAPEGTSTAILVSLQLVGDAGTPLNATVLVPCEAPKFAPLMLIEAPTGLEVGFREVMLGPGAVTVKVKALLA